MPTPIRPILLSVFFSFALLTIASAEQPLTAPDDAPRYELSNVQFGTNRLLRPEMSIDYRRVSDGKSRATVWLAGKTDDGPLRFMGPAPIVDDASGTIRLSKGFPFPIGLGRTKLNYEFYLVIRADWAGKHYGQCMVSNAVRLGNPGEATVAREWTNEERTAYEKNKRGNVPPAELPPGHQAVRIRTKLTPGMPVKVGRYGDWVDAEVLNNAPGDRVMVRLIGQQQGTLVNRYKWVAVDPQVLAQAEADPTQFQPSIRVLPDGTGPLPTGTVPVPEDLDLTPGTPLKVRRGPDWELVYVLGKRNGRILVRHAESPSDLEFPYSRSQLAINEKTLELIGTAEGEKQFAANLKKRNEEQEPSYFPGDEPDDIDGFDLPREFNRMRVIDRRYSIDIAIPASAQPLPETELPKGTKVAYCWAREWRPATVVRDEGERVVITEDERPAVFQYRLHRGDLIVQKKTVRRLAREAEPRQPAPAPETAAGRPTAAELRQTLRTWTDISGQHKVEARFVRRTADKVTIKTDAGREITLPIAKLSDADQQLLAEIKTAADNPFAP